MLEYSFPYDVMEKSYCDNIRLLFTDPDSLIYDVFYHEIWSRREHTDLGSYPTTSHFYDDTNNNVVGKIKDEANGDIILEF